MPLTTVLAGQKLEGLIRVDRPVVLQSHKVIADEFIPMDAEQYKKEQEPRDEEQIPTYLNVTMSLEPFIQIETQNEAETYPGSEKTPFLLAGSEWAKAVVEKFRKSPRRVPVFLESLECQSVFICRYLTPMKPPPQIFVPGRADAAKAPERAARYVSLIPWVGDSHLFKDMPDLTCLSQEFLDLGMGDSEEHAILLCNMFNYIDRQQQQMSGAQEVAGDEEALENEKPGLRSYIVYGQAIPDGDCWYVARRDAKSRVELWDPRTAECYVFGQSAAAGGRRGANARR